MSSKRTIHRIGNNTLIREYTANVSEKFWDVGFQYVHANKNAWDNAVWVSGEFAKRRNKSYTNNGLYTLPEMDKTVELQANRLEIMLKQGFKFSPTGVIGFHCIILDMNTNKIVVSQYLNENDFKVTSDRLLIDGSFWMVSTNIYIPKSTGVLCASITEVTADDINNETGFLYNFTAPSEPLVDKKEMVETIQTNVTFDENFYLTLTLTNSESKSIKQALIDYLNYEPQDVTVEYDIYYGNDDLGYSYLTVSNKDNYFAPIKVGLDFSKFESTYLSDIILHVTTNINYDNNLMSSETSLNVNVMELINPIINKVLEQQKPESNYPVDVTIEKIINQTVVETNVDKKVIQIIQPLFCEMIKDSFTIENKRLVFENLNEPAYLVIAKTKQTDEQIIKNDITVDNRYYFDLSKLVPVTQDTTYILYDEAQRMILGKGTVISATSNSDNIISADTP